MSTTQDYRANILKNGLARTNRFKVLIPLPNALTPQTNTTQQKKTSVFDSETVKLLKSFTGSNQEIVRGLDLMCEQTELPGKSLSTSDIKYNGDTYKIPYGVIYGNHQFVFKLSSDMYEKNILDSWMSLIFDSNNQELKFHDEISSNVVIHQLNAQDQIVHSVILKDAFPVLTNPLTLSNSESNQFHNYQVQFAYRKWLLVEDDKKSNDPTLLSQTALGPYLTPILSNPLVSKALDTFKNSTGIDLQDEALNIYNQVDDLISNSTGMSANKLKGLLDQIKANSSINPELTPQQQTDIVGLLEGIINGL